ncbi:MAG: hypothetical protein D6731_12750 [Planctomycetota bacterium]|nr:MAG: hypothetical protein D6731_12750 [Planctomycetota bacterium]
MLFGIALLLCGLVLASARLPAATEAPVVPPEEPAGSYRRSPGALRPRLAPELRFSGRDPFQAKDPWSEAAPALLAVPPARTWPRALPGGVRSLPRQPADRVLVDATWGGPR